MTADPRIRAHFDASAAAWDRTYQDDTPLGAAVTARLRGCVELIGNASTLRLLDLGCGTGALLAAAGTNVGRYAGLDLAPAMVAATRARAAALGLSSRVSTVVGDAGALPYDSACFDLVVALGLIGFVADPVGVVREALRVVRPEGRLILSAPRRGALGSAAIGQAAEARVRAYWLEPGAPPAPATGARRGAFEAIIREAGGRILRRRYFGMRPVPAPLGRRWPTLAGRAAAWAEGQAAFKACASGVLLACGK